MKALRFLVLLLMVIGSLNWGFVGFFKYDVVSHLFGMASMVTRVIFALVGLAGLYGISYLVSCCGCGCKCGPSCKCCKKD